MNKEVEIIIINKMLHEEKYSPSYQTDGSAGIDLRAMIDEDEITIKKNSTILIKTGIAINMKESSMAAVILPRSGIGHKKGIVLGNLTGLIDSDYQGEIMISCWNRSDNDYKIKKADRIAQMVFLPIISAKFKQVETFEKTERGNKGFGHTGNK